jgi:hypothetical protein
MTAAKGDLNIEQGSTWVKAWQPLLNGVALTGAWTVQAMARLSYEDPTVLYEWSTAIGNASFSSGIVTLTTTPAASSAWTWREAVYDVEVTHPTDATIKYRIAQGRILVSPEATR